MNFKVKVGDLLADMSISPLRAKYVVVASAMREDVFGDMDNLLDVYVISTGEIQTFSKANLCSWYKVLKK